MAEWPVQLGLTQVETLLLGDAVNHLSNKMNASAADITDIIGRQGGFAKVAGVNNAEIAALATTFRTAAPSSEVAATAMKNFTSTLVAGEAITKRQSDVMNRLGFDATELAQRMRVNARGSIIDMMEARRQLPEREQAASLRQLFGDEAVGAVAPLLGNLDNLRKAFKLVGDQSSYAGGIRRCCRYDCRETCGDGQLSDTAISRPDAIAFDHNGRGRSDAADVAANGWLMRPSCARRSVRKWRPLAGGHRPICGGSCMTKVMMMLGPYPFMLDTAAPQTTSRRSEYRWQRQHRIGRKPANQFLGAGLDEITLTGENPAAFRGRLCAAGRHAAAGGSGPSAAVGQRSR